MDGEMGDKRPEMDGEDDDEELDGEEMVRMLKDLLDGEINGEEIDEMMKELDGEFQNEMDRLMKDLDGELW